MDVSALGVSFDSEVRMWVMRDGQKRSCGTAQPVPGLGSESAGVVPKGRVLRIAYKQEQPGAD